MNIHRDARYHQIKLARARRNLAKTQAKHNIRLHLSMRVNRARSENYAEYTMWSEAIRSLELQFPYVVKGV